MKKFYLIIPVAMLAVVAFFFSPHGETKTNKNKVETGPSDWMSVQRMYPHNEIKQDVYLSAMKQATQDKSLRNGEIVWDFVGPTNIGGRITDIEMPAGQSNIIYIGGASGGVLKTENAGANWEQKFNGVPTISIGDLAIDPANQDIIYAGTGEANSSSFSFLGSGIYKSVDGGDNWEYSGLEASAYIGRIIVDHNNSQRVFAAACGNLFSTGGERGIYRTDDGGQNWEQVLFVNDSTSAIDLVQHPTNPNILYAAFWERKRGLTYRNSFGLSTGIWKTTDGGDNWVELTDGLPGAIPKGRLGLTISQSNPEVLYAMYDMPDQNMFVYKTSNGGENWQQVDNWYLGGMGSSFAWYFGQIRVDPNDENLVYALGQVMYKTENGGETWYQIGDNIHVDHHAMFFDQSSGKVYLGNDGGLYWSMNSGSSWIKINNLPLTQFYAFDISNTNPDFMMGGSQDNNTIRTLSGNETWQAVLGGDGMYCAINQDNDNLAYAEYQWGNLFRTTNAQSQWPNFNYISSAMEGDRKNWSAPLVLTPGDNSVAYFGTHRVWKTTSDGSTWTPVSDDLTEGNDNSFNTLTTLAVSSVNEDLVLAGSADGYVHISTNAGMSWNEISDDLPERWITRVAFDPIEEETIYVTVSGFRWDEYLPHVFKSTDLGENWDDISGDLPEIPVNVIVINPINNQNIFVGTDAGVYVTHNSGDSWENACGNMPQTPVVSLRINPLTQMLYAATYGNSIYKIDIDDLYTGIAKPVDSNNNFTATLVNKSQSEHILIETQQAQNLTINVYSVSGVRLATVSTGMVSKGKTKVDVSKYLRDNKDLIIFKVVGKSSSVSLKAI